MNGSGDARTPRQLPFDLGHVPGRTRDDFIVTPSNAEALALVDRWPDWPGTVVVLAGPPGSGKSHLAAIWRDMAGARPLSPDAIGQDIPPAALVEDADEARLDEPGLFHLINALKGAGGHLLLTARRFPAAWGVCLPDLASRLKAATTVEIREPDDALLAGVISKLFADRQVEVDAAVVQFLVRRIERSLSTAIDVVDRLDREALERKTRITRALAAEVVTALDEGQADLDL
jgi:chromosomal replication initiation ATPase DnaA